MSRSQARSRLSLKRLTEDLRDVYLDPGFVGGLGEEAPSAYKYIQSVMKAHRKLVRVRRKLTPILTHKGAEDRLDQQNL